MPEFQGNVWWSRVFGDYIPLTQFQKKSDGKLVLMQGEKGLFVQMVDTNGNPISSAVPFPVEIKNFPSKQSVGVVDPLPPGTNTLGNVGVANGANVATVYPYANSDDWSATSSSLYVASVNGGFNGVSVDRWRNNTEGLLLPSSSRTITSSSSIQKNHNARGVLLVIDVTVVPATSETLTFELKANVNGQNSWAYAFVTVPATIGKYFLMVYPGVAEKDQNKVKQYSAVVPRSWYAYVTHSGASAWTYSVSYATIV